jgi:phosphotriesterase-related protein
VSWWFNVLHINNASLRPFTTIFQKLIPALKATGFTQKEIDQLLIKNPAKAYAVSKRVFKRN